MAQIIWSETAINDLKAIGDFIRLDSKYYSKIFVKRIIGSIKKLEIFPECGRKSKVFESIELRELIFENYKILYKYDCVTVRIITIVHCKRNF